MAISETRILPISCSFKVETVFRSMEIRRLVDATRSFPGKGGHRGVSQRSIKQTTPQGLDQRSKTKVVPNIARQRSYFADKSRS